MSRHRARVSVSAYVRPDLIDDSIDSKLARLERLSADGQIDSLEIIPWPSNVPLSRGRRFTGVLDVFDRFRAWADDAGVELQPPFEVRASTSMISGEPERVLVTPALCIAVEDGDGLLAVFPHSTDEGHSGVDEGIALLERDETFTRDAVPTPALLSAGASEHPTS